MKVGVPKETAPGERRVALIPDGVRRLADALVAFLQPLTSPELVRALADRRVTAFSMDSIPRITRAQPMDALSSQSTVAGYKAVLLAASHLGKFFPMLTTAAVRAMRPGSVIVDLAAEAGGNVELTQPEETVVEDGVTIIGETNLPATMPTHASQMYSRNVLTLLEHLTTDGELDLDFDDEITRETCVAHDGRVLKEPVA